MNKKILFSVIVVCAAVTGSTAWMAAAGPSTSSLTLDDMRQEQADAWFTLRGYCVETRRGMKINASAADAAAEACTDFADSVLIRSAKEKMTMQKYMITHPESFRASEIPPIFKTHVAENYSRKK
jgi:hypothetical protein